MPLKHIALIPAYKPSSVLINLATELKQNGLTVIIVNDGSGKEYEDIFNNCKDKAYILHHMVNAGKGAALKTGLSYIQHNYGNDCVVVTVDADGQHTVKDTVYVLNKAEQNPSALVLGSRKLIGNIPARSRFGNTVTRFVYRTFSGVKLQDTQTGLRSFCGEHIPKLLQIGGSRYEYEMNMLLEFAEQKIPIIEHEIETIYENNNSSSHFNPILDSIRIYAQILKFSASSFIAFIIDYILYTVLLYFTHNLTVSNISARIISASVNFTINRKVVFKSKEGFWKSAVKYFLLAIIILIGNTTLLNFLVNQFSFDRMLAKLITEILFFCFSWFTQRFIVFKRRS